MAVSEVSICNSALQKLGAGRITALTDDSEEARECNTCYESMRDAELRKHAWNFAIARATLPAETYDPDFGPANSFPLPSDFLRLLPVDPEDVTNTNDWRIEGKKIRTNDSAPLYIRYIYRVEDPNEFDSIFREMLACSIALQICEKLTSSNQKKAAISEEYKSWRAEARRINAFENIAQEPPPDTWDTARL